MTPMFVGVGRRAGVRPQDLVGAIARETRLSGREIGAIEIADRFSLVEVPRAAADEVIAVLRQCTIKGRRKRRYAATATTDLRLGDGTGTAPAIRDPRHVDRCRPGVVAEELRGSVVNTLDRFRESARNRFGELLPESASLGETG